MENNNIMPIQNKSIWQQISNPREVYTDGYGTQREVYEPEYVTRGRDIYNKGRDVYQTVHGWFNPGENLQLKDPKTGELYKININSGAGVLMDVMDPAGVIGKVDDVSKLVKNLDSVKDKWDGLRRFQLRRRVNKAPGARTVLERNARKAELEYWDAAISDRGRAFDEGSFLEDVIERVDDRIYGNPWIKQKLEKDRLLNPLAKEYNTALKAGDTQKANDIKHRMAELVRKSYEDPYTNNHFWEDVNTRLFDTRNGGPGLTPRERQTLLLDIENPW